MPATATDIRTVLIDQLQKARRLYNVDLKYISEEQSTTCPGGVCRTPLAFTQECAGFNFYVATVLRGEEPKQRTEADLAEIAAKFDTLEKTKNGLSASVDAVISALETCKTDDLERVVTAPWGAPISLLELAVTTVQHMFYHDGQINYFQAYHGDGDVHWIEAVD